MRWLEALTLLCAGLALLRYVIGIPLLWRFIRNADLRRIPKGETPPLRVRVFTPTTYPANLVAILRQNYPAFEVQFEGDGAVPRQAHAAVPDVPISDSIEPDEGRVVLLTGDNRPDPLFLRDAANGLTRMSDVRFVSVRFGMKSGRARRAALIANSDYVLDQLLTGGRTGDERAIAFEAAATYRSTVLARRPLRLHAPDLPLEGGGIRHLRFLPAVAPMLLIVMAFLNPAHHWGALWLLAALTLLRAAVAATVDLAFARDGSTLRSLVWLPVLWFMEPLMTNLSRASRSPVRATLRSP